MNEKVKAKTH